MKTTKLFFRLNLMLFAAVLSFLSCNKAEAQGQGRQVPYGGSKMTKSAKEIYFAGGCFWGVEGYFKKVPGVLETDTGYANGKTQDTSYRQIDATDHAETVKIKYDASIVSLQELLPRYFKIIDPTSVNKQGNDRGRQYRTGIYYTDSAVKPEITDFIQFMQKKYAKPIVVEVGALQNFILAEDYHQDYLDKNPGGYCHIDLTLARKPLYDESRFKAPSKAELKKTNSIG